MSKSEPSRLPTDASVDGSAFIDAPAFSSNPEKLFTFKSGGWVLLLAAFFTLVAAGLVLYPVWVTGGFHRAIGDGKNVETYGFDLSNLTLSPGQLVASSNPKDQIRAIPVNLVETFSPEEVDLIARNEHIRFLVPKDEVIGIIVDGQVRAYPLRILTQHELVNDVVGGKAIAVTYSPLCDAIVVFDRHVDGDQAEAVEFGVSGLLVDSDSVFFDRRSDAKKESLWPQLALQAVSGPLAGKKMKLVPYELTTWEAWRKAHPETRVLQGLRTLKTEYGSEPYSTYRSNDGLKFPVSPLWEDRRLPRKTRVEVTSADGEHWVAGLASPDAGAGAKDRVYASIFAWYAQHEKDTDYSAIAR